MQTIEILAMIRAISMTVGVGLFIILGLINAVWYIAKGGHEIAPNRLSNQILVGGLIATTIGVLTAFIEIILTN